MLSTLSPFTSDRWMIAPFSRLRREMDEAFAQAFGSLADRPVVKALQAPLSMRETNDHLYVEIDVPGFKHDDLEVTVKDGKLWITGERKFNQENGSRWYDERVWGRFERVISLPDSVDCGSIQADLEDGVLTVTLAKRPEARPTRIAINGHKSEQKRLETESVQN